MKKILALLLAAAMLLSVTSCVVDKKAYVSGLDDNADFSGVVVMTKNEKTVYEVTGGVENDDTDEPITTDTLFCVGSVSKQFAAAAILTLQQDGKLSVNDPITRYYPQYTIGKSITLRQMLDMRSGITEFYDVEYIDKAFTELPTGELRDTVTNDKTVAENRKTLEDWLLKQPLQFEPDTDFEYSNSNYFLLARIVEKVSGKSYEAYVREKIFKPLGMTHSSFIDEVDFKSVPHLAAPTVHPQTVYVGITMGLGDMISNAGDIDRWLSSFKTKKILNKESIKLMRTDYTDTDEDDYGFGVRVTDNGIYHSGSITTYQTMVYTDTDKGVNIFAVTNDEPNTQLSVSDIVWTLIDQSDL